MAKGRSGVGGPLPKPEGTRRSRHTPTMPLHRVTAPEAELTWPPADPEWHPLAADVYASLPKSAQVQLFQPSDVSTARVIVEGLSRGLKAQRLSPTLFAACLDALDDLASTVGARLRLRVSVEEAPGEEPPSAAVVKNYRVLLGGSPDAS